jgi:hypothetical protein
MQMEYMKSAPYIYGNTTYYEEYPEHDYVVYNSVDVPNESYLINVVAQPVDIYPEDPDDPDTIIIHEALPEGQDEGIQEITVEIYHVNKEVGVDMPVLVARNYKVAR